jgi:SAM-dependent methyltransferase
MSAPPRSTTQEAAPGVKLRASRYAVDWVGHFLEQVERFLNPDAVILDVGPGPSPSLPPERRPADCHYVALDVSAQEVDRAPAGSYDEVVVGDVGVPMSSLDGRFDLIVSWQVLEHVEDLQASLENLRRYLKPGGHLVALFSGKFSAFAALNHLIPRRGAVLAMQHLLGRDPRTVFPAYYDRCYDGALKRLVSHWSSAEVEPLYRGAIYFRFSGVLQRLYVAYEGWACDGGHRNLATHYLLSAAR